jgi:hypothetical protein
MDFYAVRLHKTDEKSGMNAESVEAFRAGDVQSLTLAETLELKEVMNVTRRGETATFTSDMVARWLLLRGAKFKDFGFKYEIQGLITEVKQNVQMDQ